MTAAHMSHYGYPVADLDGQPVEIKGRTVFVSSIYWDDEYESFRAIGFYAKKDGTAGKQYAKPWMSASEVPADVRTSLEALK